MRRLVAIGALMFSCATGGTVQREQPPQRIVMEEHRVPFGSGIELYLRNKHPDGMTQFAPERTLLFVHGATYPAETSFDLPLGNTSWMEFIAQRGFDVWLVDLPGYGRSTRPPEMSEPPEKNPPLVRTDAAVHAVATAVAFIQQKRGVVRLDLMGWSWGTSIMGGFAAANPDKVERLVLYAPQWIPSTPALISGQGAYRTVSIQATKDRWLKGVAEDKKPDLIPAGWFEQWSEATFATDPVGSQANPRTLRAPNGVIADIKEFWSEGKPLYDPTQVRAPTLLVHAEWDQDLPSYMAKAVFEKLTNAHWKRYVEIGEGTHTVMMEKNRMQLFREVQAFLEEPAP